MRRIILLPIILLLTMTHFTGCSTAKSWYEKGTDSVISMSSKIIPGRTPVLKKKVLLLPLLDQAEIGEEKTEEITADLIKLLEQDGHLVIKRSEIPLQNTAGIRSPELGIIIPPELAQMSEEMGMNVLITGVLSPFEITTKKTGIWPWRRFKKEIEISFILNVFDITSGTLFITNLEKGKTTQDVETTDEREVKTEIVEAMFDREITHILYRHASTIKGVLNSHPWTGRLLSISNDKIMINAGKDVRIKAGNVFVVYEGGEPIRTASGQPLYLRGSKVGEIKIAEVKEHYALAVPLTGKQFKPGHLIRLKR